MYNLLNLIIASGYSGVTGQSFRNHVTGSGTGAKVTDYLCTDWHFHLGSGYLIDPFPEIDATPYPSGTVFNFYMDLVTASRFFNIRRDGSSVVSYFLNDEGRGAALSAISLVVSDDMMNVFSFTILGSYNPSAAIDTEDADFAPGEVDEESPDLDPHLVRFEVSSGSGAGAGTQTQTVEISYFPDSGLFNTELFASFAREIQTRVRPIGEFDIEWSTSPTGPEDLGTDSTAEVMQSVYNETITVYYRWRVTGGSVWSAWNDITFDDWRA